MCWDVHVTGLAGTEALALLAFALSLVFLACLAETGEETHSERRAFGWRKVG